MKKVALFSMICLFFISTNSKIYGGNETQNKEIKVDTTSLQNVLKEIRKTLNTANRRLSEFNWPVNSQIALQEACIQLSVTVDLTGGGGASILKIIKLGAEVNSEKTSSVSYVFKADSIKLLNSTNAVNRDYYSDDTTKHNELVKLIVGAAIQFNKSMESIPSMKPETFEIEQSFDVTISANAGIDVIVFSISAEGKKSNGQKITLKYGRPPISNKINVKLDEIVDRWETELKSIKQSNKDLTHEDLDKATDNIQEYVQKKSQIKTKEKIYWSF